MQFYIIYLKELKERFHICPLIVQLVEADMIWDLEQYENNYSVIKDVISSLYLKRSYYALLQSLDFVLWVY